MNKYLAIIIAIVIIIVLGYLAYNLFFVVRPLPPIIPAGYVVGDKVDVDIQTPHPYPKGDESEPVVYSYTLEHSEPRPIVVIHFKDFELAQGDYVLIKLKDGTIFDRLDLSDNIRTFTEEDLYDKFGNYICEDEIPGRSYTEYPLSIEDCLAELEFTERLKHMVLLNSYRGDESNLESITLELHADGIEESYGFSIDYYIYRFTSEEAQTFNQQRIQEAIKNCAKQGIPPEECIITL